MRGVWWWWLVVVALANVDAGNVGSASVKAVDKLLTALENKPERPCLPAGSKCGARPTGVFCCKPSKCCHIMDDPPTPKSQGIPLGAWTCAENTC